MIIIVRVTAKKTIVPTISVEVALSNQTFHSGMHTSVDLANNHLFVYKVCAQGLLMLSG